MSGIAAMFFGGSGNLSWVATVSPATPTSLAVGYDDADAPFIVGGGTTGTKEVADEAYAISLDWQHNVVWDQDTASFSINYDDCAGIALDSSYNTILPITDHTYLYLYKLDINGDTLWRRKFNTSSLQMRRAFAAVDGSDNVYVAGLSGAVNTAIVLMKYNSSGALQWYKTLTVTGSEELMLNALSVNSSGDIVIGGYVDANTGTYPYYGFIARYNSSGTLDWQKKVEGSFTNTYVNGVTQDASGNIYFTTSTNTSTFFSGGEVQATSLYDVGTVRWSYQAPDYIYEVNKAGTATDGVSIGPDGYLYVAHSPAGSFGSPMPADIYKYNASTGSMQFCNTLAAVTGYSVDSAIVVDTTNNMWVACGSKLLYVPSDGSKTGSNDYTSRATGATSNTFTYSSLGFTDGTPSVTDDPATGDLAPFTATVSYTDF